MNFAWESKMGLAGEGEREAREREEARTGKGLSLTCAERGCALALLPPTNADYNNTFLGFLLLTNVFLGVCVSKGIPLDLVKNPPVTPPLSLPLFALFFFVAAESLPSKSQQKVVAQKQGACRWAAKRGADTPLIVFEVGPG